MWKENTSGSEWRSENEARTIFSLHIRRRSACFQFLEAELAYLHVKMYNVVGMNEFDALAYLPHYTDTRLLGQKKVFSDHSVEQLASVNTISK